MQYYTQRKRDCDITRVFEAPGYQKVIEIKLFGGLTIFTDGVAVPEPDRRLRAHDVLTYVLARRTNVPSRDEAIRAVYGSKTDTTSNYCSRALGWLRDLVKSDGVAPVPSDLEAMAAYFSGLRVDLICFEDDLTASEKPAISDTDRKSHLLAAIAAYSENFGPAYPEGAAPEWLQMKRAELLGRYVACARRLAHILSAEPNIPEAIAVLEAAARRAPTDAETCKDIMMYHAMRGSPADVTRAYQTFCAAISEVVASGSGRPLPDAEQIAKVKAAHEVQLELARHRQGDLLQALPRPARITTIPRAPEPYVAHEYTLLQTGSLIGRDAELATLTGWLDGTTAKPVMSVVAMGGGGKSALTWSWFASAVSQAVPSRFQGALWWSFYEADGGFENFVTRALCYVAGSSVEECERITLLEREEALLSALATRPFLIVLDGAERLMVAYSRMDAALMFDENVDMHSFVTGPSPTEGAENGDERFFASRSYRISADPHVGKFLKRLARLQASKTLITTRLDCADLQTAAGAPIPGCASFELPGLLPLDALRLWESLGASGARHGLLRMFERLGHHPLLVQVLAGEVAEWSPSPGDFDRWVEAHPDFALANLPARNVKAHVLAYAMGALRDVPRTVLACVSAFRMPVDYDVLAAVLAADHGLVGSEAELEAALMEIRNRRLVGWDARTRRYDLHPLVRAASWKMCQDERRKVIFGSMRAYFETLPYGERDQSWTQVRRVEDVATSIELFNALVGEERYDDAYHHYRQMLHLALSERLKAYQLQSQLLEQLFTDEAVPVPLVTEEADARAATLHYAGALLASGQPLRASKVAGEGSPAIVRIRSLIACGRIYEAEFAARIACAASLAADEAEFASRKPAKGDPTPKDSIDTALRLSYLGYILALQDKGAYGFFDRCYSIRQQYPEKSEYYLDEYLMCAMLSEWLLLQDQPDNCRGVALTGRSAMQWFNEQHEVPNVAGDYVRSDYLVGRSYVHEEDWDKAKEHLYFALVEARRGSIVQDEIQVSIALADLALRLGQLDHAHECLSGVWEPIYRGPYPLLHADALHVLARIQLDEGDQFAAAQTATEAYRAAWCDGPPFAYQTRLTPVAEFLAELGEDAPADLVPISPAARKPMPPVRLR